MDQSIGLLPKKMYAKYYKRQNHAPADSLRLRPLQQDNSLIGPTARFGTGKKTTRLSSKKAKKLKTGGKMPSSFINQNGIIGDFMSLKPLSKPKSLIERLRRT
jgi:hypothetical protein